MQFLEFKILSLTFLLLFTLSAIRGDADESPLHEAIEKPGMLARVNRAPGIFPGEPSIVPTGEQAELYYDLLETDPEKTSFRERSPITKEPVPAFSTFSTELHLP